MSVYQNLCVGPYAEWAVPVQKDPGPIPDTSEWEWYSNGEALHGADNLGEIPEEKRGPSRFHVYRFMPRSGRAGEPARSIYFGGPGGVGALDLTEVNRQAEIAWFSEAFRVELHQIAEHFGFEPAIRWGCVGWIS